MRFSPLTLVLLAQQMAEGEAASSTITSTTGYTSTKLVTATNSPTLVWTTSTLANGVITPFKTAYSQKFTAYFSGIAQPLSGSIGLGYISESVGESRNYPLTTAAEASSIYSEAENYSGAYNYTGPLSQELSTDSSGRIIPRSWATVVALGGDSTWYGPSYSQASQDLTGWSTTTTADFGRYTDDSNTAVAAATSSSPAAAAAAASPAVSTTTSPAAAAAGAVTTTTSPAAAAAAGAVTTTTSPAAAAAAGAVTTTTSPAAAAAPAAAVSTTSPAAAAAAPAAAVSTTSPAAAAAAAVSTTSPVAAGVPSTSVPGVAVTTSAAAAVGGAAAVSTTAPAV